MGHCDYKWHPHRSCTTLYGLHSVFMFYVISTFWFAGYISSEASACENGSLENALKPRINNRIVKYTQEWFIELFQGPEESFWCANLITAAKSSSECSSMRENPEACGKFVSLRRSRRVSEDIHHTGKHINVRCHVCIRPEQQFISII